MSKLEILSNPFLVLALARRAGCPAIIRELGEHNVASMLQRTAGLFPAGVHRVPRDRITTGGRPPRRYIPPVNATNATNATSATNAIAVIAAAIATNATAATVIDIDSGSDDEAVKEVIVVDSGSDCDSDDLILRPRTQTLWELPSSELLHPLKHVTIIFWVRDDISGVIMKSVAVCIRRDNTLVLFDHKVVIERETRLTYQDNLLIRRDFKWVAASWHNPIPVRSKSVIVFKTEDANTGHWVVDCLF